MDGNPMNSRISERRFGKRTFRMEPMLATKALIMQARLFRLAGPALERLPEILVGIGAGKSEEERTIANAAAVQGFVSVFQHTSPEDLADMIRELAELAQIKRPSGSWEKVDLDGDFTGEQGDLIPLVVWVAQEQFGDFFSGLLAIGSRGSQGRG
jgi:hypothetical protein